MRYRKWLVRGLVFSIAGGMALAAAAYFRWTSPDVIRQQVIDKLSAQFPGATVTLDSAHLRLLGGIAVSEVRLARKDDPDKTEFAYIPSGVIYHDKEQLLEGRLAIRKVELYRPRLRALRNKDGHWNVEGIIGKPQPDVPIPTIVVHQGTVLLEDLLVSAARPAIEFKDISLTFVNDPLPQVTVRVAGKADLAGTLHAAVSWNRRSDALGVSLEAPAIPIRPALVLALANYLPQQTDYARQLEGTGSLRADFGYQPENSQPWSHDVRFHLKNGKLRHPQVPLPLEQLEAAVRCLDGELKVESATARSGPTRLELTGRARLPDPAAQKAHAPGAPPRPASPGGADVGFDFSGDLRVEHLEVTSDLFARLPHHLQRLNTEYAPLGPVSLTFHCEHAGGHWLKRCVIRPEDLVVSFWKFPYPLEHVTGSLDQEIDTQRRLDLLTVDLVGQAGGQSVFIKGNVTGEGPTAGVDLEVWGDGLAIDEKLHAALPPAHQKLARSFHPLGQLDVRAYVRKPEGSTQFDNRYVISFHHASVRYDVFPYPLEGVTGCLDIHEDHWECRDFQGQHKGGTFRVSGRSLTVPREDHFNIEISGENVQLDAELEGALEPELRKTWKVFNPTGRMDFVALVDHQPGRRAATGVAGPTVVDVTITAHDCSIRPTFFPYALEHLDGRFRYDGARQQVLVSHVQARHGPTQVALGGAEAVLKPDGGYWVKLTALRGTPLVIDKDLLDALLPALRKACLALQLRDPVGLHLTSLTIDSAPEEGNLPVIHWDGKLALRDATVYAGVMLEHVTGEAACLGLYDGREKQLDRLIGNLDVERAVILNQPFRNIQSQIEMKKDEPLVLRLPGLHAQIYGGEVYGPARVEFGPTLHYELNLTASQIQLEEFGRQNLSPGAPISGLASARLFLKGEGTELQSLEGNGNLDVPNGRLYNLPLLLDLLKFLGLRMPDRTAFEEAHVRFAVKGTKVTVSQFDLIGNSFSLKGDGDLNLDGTGLNLDFYAVWARVLQYLPPLIKDIPHAFSRQLLKIKMRGKLGGVELHGEPVPVVVEPLRELWDRTGGRRRHPK